MNTYTIPVTVLGTIVVEAESEAEALAEFHAMQYADRWLQRGAPLDTVDDAFVSPDLNIAVRAGTTCPRCRGRGRWPGDDDPCQACHGTGRQ